MEDMLFDNWSTLQRTVLISVLAYVSLLIFLRVSGKRTLSKMNAFDFVVTIALGSTLATILLNQNVSLAEGALALALLIIFQFLITWTSTRVSWFRRLVTGEPSLLLHEGEFLSPALNKARVTRDEIRAAVRARGIAQLEDVYAVVLETDGSFSVIQDKVGTGHSSLSGVEVPLEHGSRKID